MKKITLRNLVAAAMMMLGMNSYADTWSIDFAALGKNYDDKTNVAISNSVVTISGTDMGTCTVGEEALNSNFVLQTGTTWLMRKENGLYQGNGGGRSMGILNCTGGQIITIVGTGNPNSVTNATLKSASGNTYVYTVNENGNVKFTPARYLYFTFISVEDPSVTEVSYTVSYVNGDGVELKPSESRTGEPNTAPTLLDSDKEMFEADGVTYVYSSDDAASQSIAPDGSTVVKVVFREAAIYNYQVKADDGTLISEGSGYETSTVIVPYPRFMLSETTLKEASAINKEYRLSFTLDANNIEKTINYNYSTMENVVFFKEAEDIDGMTAVTTGQVQVRGSNAAGGFSADEINITTLPAGKYTIYGSMAGGTNKEGGTNATATVTCGNGQSFTWKTTGSYVDYSNEVMLMSQSDVTISVADGAGGNNSRCVDLIYIVKTGDVESAITVTIAECGYATLCSEYALDFTENNDVKAYIVEDQEVSDKVVTTEVTKVPAGAGIILKGEVGSCTINTTTEEVEELTNNMMVGVLVDTNLDENCGYILYTDGLFHPCGGGTLAAGKAYLGITPPASQAGAKPLTIVFEVEGTATAVKNVETNVSNESIYTLSGTRLNGQPTQHGVYIIGGKKVVK